MSRIGDRLEELGIVLPAPMDPPGNFELVTVHDGVAYVAGHAPIDRPGPEGSSARVTVKLAP